MITYENIKDVNERVNRVELRKGKHYAMVAARVQAFRELIPNGCIETDIVRMQDDLCVVKATIRDSDGNVLATGHAYERESNGQINRTSFVENCETSAVGRALGMIGIGSEESMASAEEMVQALYQQGLKDQISTLTPDVPDEETQKQRSVLRDQIMALAGNDQDRVDSVIRAVNQKHPDRGFDASFVNLSVPHLQTIKRVICERIQKNEN